MIKKTRLKFFAVTSGIAILIIFLFCETILLATSIRDNVGAKNTLVRVVAAFENRPLDGSDVVQTGVVDQDAPRSQINELRTFVVRLDENDNIILMPHPAATHYSDEEIRGYVAEILGTGNLEGFMVIRKVTDNGDIIAAINMSIENEAFKRLTLVTLLIGFSGSFVLLTIVWHLSYWMVKPAEQSLEKQKRFVSEASHELKTPLTVVSAGVELLQREEGLSRDAKRWIADIKSQTKKMTKMITDMISLSKIQEQSERRENTEFDLSGVVNANALPFESVAFEQNKSLVCGDIEEGILYKGNAKAVCDVIQILCDNAIKHSGEKAIINVGLKKQSSKIILSVTNTGANVAEEEIPLLFERFYRGSESRAKVSGTGLGLSILKTISEQNGWKTNVKVIEGTITFSIIM